MRMPDADNPAVLLCGGAADMLPALPERSVHCVCTSPPFFGLRDYETGRWVGGDPACDHGVRRRDGPKQTQGAQSGHAARADRLARRRCVCGARREDAQIGLEDTPAAYVRALVRVFARVWRVLRDDGTVWLNLGDTYCTHPHGPPGANAEDPKWVGARVRGRTEQGQANRSRLDGFKHKDRLMIPARVAIALQKAGWYLRDEVVWAKPNPMTMSVTDRTVASHEMIYLLAKRPKYFFDHVAVHEPAVTAGRVPKGKKATCPEAARACGRKSGNTQRTLSDQAVALTRNKRSVWPVATVSYSGAHFAVWPPGLVRPMVLASTSARGVCPGCGAPWARLVEKTRVPTRPGQAGKLLAHSDGDAATAEANGWNRDPGRHVTEYRTVGWEPTCRCDRPDVVPATVLDPFCGSGTTLKVAVESGRYGIGIDLSERYLDLARARLKEPVGVGSLFGPAEVPVVTQPGLFGEGG
jgi:DNA modification methylase